MEKLPPIEKVYEAWSAVADGRVALHPDERRAAIASSNGAKTYTVAWNENGSTYSSNDNATYWQGYHQSASPLHLPWNTRQVQ